MSSFINALIRFRWLFFVASLLLLGFALAGFQHFKFDGSPRAFFSSDNPSYARFESLEDTYGSDLKIFLMLSVEDGSIMDPQNLEAIQELTDKAWELPFVRRVDSLSNYQYTHSSDDELFVEDIFGEPVINDPDLLAERQAVALSELDIVNRLVSKDGKHAAVILSLTLTSEQTQTGEGADLLHKNLELNKYIEARYPDISIAATGSLLSTVYSSEVARKDMMFMIPAMFGLMFLVLGLLLRSISTVFISFGVAFCSALGALGLASWLGITFSVLSVNAVIISITVAVAHCIHIFTQLFKELQTQNKLDAIASSLRINFFAVTVTTLTTLIGFLSLNTNDLPPAADLGNAAAIGSAMAWLLSLTMLPALVSILPFKAHKTSELLIDRVMDKLADVLIRRKYLVLAFMTGLTALMVTMSFMNDLNDRFVVLH